MKTSLGTEVGLVPDDIVLDGGLQLPLKRGTTQFSAHVYCGQTAGWIKMALGTEVGLSPGDFVLDGDPAPTPQKWGGVPSPIFGPFLLWPNCWMHQDATWYGDRPQTRRLCVRVRSSPLPKKVAEPPNFWPMSTVAKRLDGSRCHLVRR